MKVGDKVQYTEYGIKGAKGVIAKQQMNSLGKSLLQAQGSLEQTKGDTVLSRALGLVE